MDSTVTGAPNAQDGRARPEDVHIVRALKLIVEVLWVTVQVIYHIVSAIISIILPPERKDVSKEIVLITGAGHGIGQQIALRFSKLGAIIVCVDVNAKGNEETVRLIESSNGKAFQYQCDVSDRKAVMELASKVKADVGDVGILLNNAGILRSKRLIHCTEQDIQSVMNVNALAHYWTIQAFLPSMLERNHGHVVAIASLAGYTGLNNLVPYCGSKFAVRGIMESLRAELNEDQRDTRGIKLTTVCPYFVSTGLVKKPKFRWSSFLNYETPEAVADAIVDAVLRNYTEIAVPGFLYYLNKYFMQVLPKKANDVIAAFINVGVHPDE